MPSRILFGSLPKKSTMASSFGGTIFVLIFLFRACVLASTTTQWTTTTGPTEESTVTSQSTVTTQSTVTSPSSVRTTQSTVIPPSSVTTTESTVTTQLKTTSWTTTQIATSPTTTVTQSLIATTTPVTSKTKTTTTATSKYVSMKTSPDNPVLSSISVRRGPEGGGTVITGTGKKLNTISAIYFGDLSSGDILNSSTYDTIVFRSPVTSRTGNVTIVMTWNGVNVTTDVTFEYRQNPVIRDFDYAPWQLTSGGSVLTVVGDNLDSAVSPLLNATVVFTEPSTKKRSASDSQTKSVANSYFQKCDYSDTTQNLTCLIPDLKLPDSFTRKLQDDQNKNLSTSTREPGSVAKLTGPNNTTALVYLGLVFDGYRKYQNISDPTSGVQNKLQLNFIPPPTINGSTDVLTFDPETEESVEIKGSRLSLACSYGVLCGAKIGDAICEITETTDNIITCIPPRQKPSKPLSDVFCRQYHPDSLPFQVTIGSRVFQYRCLEYYFRNVALIVGLVLGLGVPALAVIFVALCCLYRRRKLRQKSDDRKTQRSLPLSAELEEFPIHYSAPNIPMSCRLDNEENRAYEELEYHRNIDDEDFKTQDTLFLSLQRYTRYPTGIYSRTIEDDDLEGIDRIVAEDGDENNSFSLPPFPTDDRDSSSRQPEFPSVLLSNDLEATWNTENAIYANAGELKGDRDYDFNLE